LAGIQDDNYYLTLRPAGVGGGKMNDDGVLVIDESYKLVYLALIPTSTACKFEESK
jgi:hypothetical protein